MKNVFTFESFIDIRSIVLGSQFIIQVQGPVWLRYTVLCDVDGYVTIVSLDPIQKTTETPWNNLNIGGKCQSLYETIVSS